MKATSRKFLNMSVHLAGGMREYEWLMMPMGLSVAPSHWCAFVNSVMQSLARFRKSFVSRPVIQATGEAYCVVYADDILVGGPDEESVGALLNVLLQVLGFLGWSYSTFAITTLNNGLHRDSNSAIRTGE
jgi:hypothetical protein